MSVRKGKAMTNTEIIDNLKVNLYRKGLIKGYRVASKDGTETYGILYEDVFTKSGWKKRGMKVKDGENPLAKERLWLKRNNGQFFKKKAEFYSDSQVEMI